MVPGTARVGTFCCADGAAEEVFQGSDMVSARDGAGEGCRRRRREAHAFPASRSFFVELHTWCGGDVGVHSWRLFLELVWRKNSMIHPEIQNACLKLRQLFFKIITNIHDIYSDDSG